jgi:hypothetical protein
VEIPQKLVEVAARALCVDDAAEADDLTFSWDMLPEYHREFYRETAYIVLEAAFLECQVKELSRIEIGPGDYRTYTPWTSRPIGRSLSIVMDKDKDLVVERKLVIECPFDPVAVRNEEVL